MTRRNRMIVYIISGAVVFIIVIVALLLVRYANVIAKAGIENALGKDFTMKGIELTWGSVRVTGAAMKDKGGKEIIRVDEIVVKADFMNFLRDKYVISSLVLEKPYMYVEVDKKGNLVSPVFPTVAGKTDRKGREEKAKPPAAKASNPPVVFKKITIRKGAVDYLDRKSPSVPVLTKVRDIDLDMQDITVPFTDDASAYGLNALVLAGKSKATVKSEGKVKFKSRDVTSVSRLRGLDITHFKPYYDKGGKVHIKRGLMDMDIRATVVKRKINAPGRAVLKGLEFDTGSGIGGKFMGVPVNLVSGYLKKGGDEIPVEFVISGDLDNPKFNLTEDFMNRLAFGLAAKLGLSVTDIGGSIFGVGTDSTRDVGESVKEGFKKLFGK